jgi:hypothetical protein
VEDGGEAAGVGAFAVLDVAGEQLALGPRRIGAGRPLEPPLGQVLPHAGACALQRAVDRCDARLEQVCGLSRRAVEHVAEDEHGTRQRREVLDRGQERKLDRLLLDYRGVRLILLGHELLQQLVRVGLQPRDLTRDSDPRALVQGIEAGVRRDLVQPRADRRASRERGPAAPGAQEGLLHEILAVVEGAQHAVAVQVQLASMPPHLRGERGLVAVQAVILGGDGHMSVTASAAKSHHPPAGGCHVILCASAILLVRARPSRL